VGNWLALYEQEGLSSFLTLRTRPDNSLSLDDQKLGQLRERLRHPAGFGNSLEVRDWSAERFRKSLGYSTVHQLVHHRLRSKLKVPRKSMNGRTRPSPCSSKKFSDILGIHLGERRGAERFRLFFQDESRCGLHSVERRRIAVRGVKPKVTQQMTSGCYYLFGAVEPTTGDGFLLELPALNTETF